MIINGINLLCFDFARIFSKGNTVVRKLINADLLFIPLILKDVFKNGGRFTDWSFPPALFLFPDYPLAIVAFLSHSNIYTQMVIISIVQVIFTFLIMKSIAKYTIGEKHLIGSLTIIVFLLGLATNNVIPFNLIFKAVFHYGAFLMVLFLIVLWMRFNEENNKYYKIGLFIVMSGIAFATTFSDPLFILWFIVPFIVIEFILAIRKRDFSLKNKLPLVGILFFSVLGLQVYKWIRPSAVSGRAAKPLTIDNLIDNFDKIIEPFNFVIQQSSIFGVFLLLYIGITLYNFILLCKGKRDNSKLSWIFIFSFLSICTTTLLMVLSDELYALRYQIPTFFWIIIIPILYIYHFWYKRILPIAITCIIFITLKISLVSYKGVKEYGFIKYYPKYISCIDEVLKKEKLDNGIAEFWDAKVITGFSKLNLNIAYHNIQLEKQGLSSKRHFKSSYDFAVLKKIIDDYTYESKDYLEAPIWLKAVAGEPKLIKDCSRYWVYVYGKDKLNIQNKDNIGSNFEDIEIPKIEVGEELIWKGCELSTHLGKQTQECFLTKDKSTRGLLTYGPYQKLPAGNYQFEIEYNSVNNSKEQIGNWSVSISNFGEVKNKIMSGSDGKNKRIIGKFALNESQHMEAVEVRIWAESNKDLTVHFLKIKRIQ